MKANLYLSWKYAIKNKGIIITLSVISGLVFFVMLLVSVLTRKSTGYSNEDLTYGEIDIWNTVSSLLFFIMAGIISGTVHSDFNKKGLQVVLLSKKTNRNKIFWARNIVVYLLFWISSIIISLSFFIPSLISNKSAYQIFLHSFGLCFFISITILPVCIALSVMSGKVMGIMIPLIIYIAPNLLIIIAALSFENINFLKDKKDWIAPILDLSKTYTVIPTITTIKIFDVKTIEYTSDKDWIQLIWFFGFIGLFFLSYFSFLRKDFK